MKQLLYPTPNRRDFYCVDCGKLFSLYIPKGERITKPFCPYPDCGDNVAVEKYSVAKHGSHNGRYKPWSRQDIAALKRMLEEPISWVEIAAKLGRSMDAAQRFAQTQGLKKKYRVVSGLV